jgi:D-alanyl-D-alanine carboxypeptidase
MQERLFEPLGMKKTMLPPADSNTLPKPFTHGYLYGSSSVALVGTPPYSPEVEAAAKAGTLLPNDYTNVNHSFAFGTGGVVSTASDCAIWIRCLATGRVLNPE